MRLIAHGGHVQFDYTMKNELDFSKAERGKFHNPGTKLALPSCADAPPPAETLSALLKESRKAAKAAGLTKADLQAAIAKVRRTNHR